MPTIVSSYVQTLAGSVDARTVDALTFPFTARPQAMSIYVKFQERGSVLLASGTRIVHIGTTTATGARLGIFANGSGFYAATYNNGISSSVASTLSTAGAVGQIVELLLTLTAGGIVQLSQSIQGATVTSATASSARVLPTAWAATSLDINALGSSLVGAVALLNLVIVRGVQDMATMRRLAGTDRR